MNTDKHDGASIEQVLQLLEDLGRIIPTLTMMPPDAKADLMKQLDRVHPRFSRRFLAEAPTMQRIAGMLCRDPNPTISELSKELSLPLSSLSHIVDMMEEGGFANRHPDAQDSRVVRVGMTDTGKQVHEAMLSRRALNARRVLDCLTPEEQIILLTLLGKVASKLEKDE